jgi:hypothetical protein
MSNPVGPGVVEVGITTVGRLRPFSLLLSPSEVELAGG